MCDSEGLGCSSPFSLHSFGFWAFIWFCVLVQSYRNKTSSDPWHDLVGPFVRPLVWVLLTQSIGIHKIFRKLFVISPSQQTSHATSRNPGQDRHHGSSRGVHLVFVVFSPSRFRFSWRWVFKSSTRPGLWGFPPLMCRAAQAAISPPKPASILFQTGKSRLRILVCQTGWSWSDTDRIRRVFQLSGTPSGPIFQRNQWGFLHLCC